MEDNKRNELSDEALEAVDGGAAIMYNDETGKFDVFRGDGSRADSVDTRKEAEELMKRLTAYQVRK